MLQHIKQTSITLTEGAPFNSQCYNITHTTNYHTHSHANHNYARTRRRLCNEHFFTYYAGIMLDAFLHLFCSKLCWHSWRRPSTHMILIGNPYKYITMKLCTQILQDLLNLVRKLEIYYWISLGNIIIYPSVHNNRLNDCFDPYTADAYV